MMHDDIVVDESMVRRLLSRTTPQWADLPVRRLASSGTDNAIYRVGEKLLLRLPRREAAANLITKELDWLPRFGDLLLDVPKLYFRGRIDFGLKGEFGIFEWMEGDIAAPQNIADPLAAALALASFLNALHRVDTEDYAAAWTWVDQSARDAFRSACGIEDADWLRAEGWALYAAVIALSYYRGGKNEALCEQSRLTLSRLNMR